MQYALYTKNTLIRFGFNLKSLLNANIPIKLLSALLNGFVIYILKLNICFGLISASRASRHICLD